MNQETYDRIKAACLEFKAKGGRIIEGEWGLVADEVSGWQASNNCACAMGCLLVKEQPATVDEFGDGLDEETATSNLLGTSIAKVSYFIEGFDDGHPPCEPTHRDWYEAGKRMRAELLSP